MPMVGFSNFSATRTITDIVGEASGDRGWYPTDDETQMGELYTDTPGNVVNTDPVGRIVPTAGTIDMLQTTSGSRPTWVSANGSVSLDGTDDFLLFTESAGWGSTMTIALAIKGTDAGSVILNTGDESGYLFPAISGDTSSPLSNNAGTPTFRVDGSAYTGTTPDDVYTDIMDGSWHTIYIEGADLSAARWNDLLMGYYGGLEMLAEIADVVIVPDVSSADRTIIEDEIAGKH